MDTYAYKNSRIVNDEEATISTTQNQNPNFITFL